jgi:hypothetical protein
MIVGGFLVAFGTAYAGGCTSGHAIAGLADFQAASLLAVCGFFAGGLIATYFVLPTRPTEPNETRSVSVALHFQDARVDAVCNVNRLQVLRHRKLMGLADVVRIGLVAPFTEPSQNLAVPIELEHHAFHAG